MDDKTLQALKEKIKGAELLKEDIEHIHLTMRDIIKCAKAKGVQFEVERRGMPIAVGSLGEEELEETVVKDTLTIVPATLGLTEEQFSEYFSDVILEVLRKVLDDKVKQFKELDIKL